jgi:hypothetical protein
MLKPDDPRAQLAVITGQRSSAEQLLDALRKNLAGWLDAEAKKGPVRRALLWDHNEEWRKRVEGLATQLEQHVVGIRTHELLLKQQAGAPATKRAKRKAATKRPARRGK